MELRFLRLPRPSEDDVYEVAMGTAKKVAAYFVKKGQSDKESNGKGAGEIEAALAACSEVAARATKKVIEDGHRMDKGEMAVVVDGFNAYARTPLTVVIGSESRECVCASGKIDAPER